MLSYGLLNNSTNWYTSIDLTLTLIFEQWTLEEMFDVWITETVIQSPCEVTWLKGFKQKWDHYWTQFYTMHSFHIKDFAEFIAVA